VRRKPASVRAEEAAVFENEIWAHRPDLIDQDHANRLTRSGDNQGGEEGEGGSPAHVVHAVPSEEESSDEEAHRHRHRRRHRHRSRRALVEAQQATHIQAQWRGFACRDRCARWWHEKKSAVPRRRGPRSVVDSKLEADDDNDDDDDLFDAQDTRSDAPSDDVSVGGGSDPRSDDVLSEAAEREDSIGGESDDSSFRSLLGDESVTRLQARWRGFATRFLRARSAAAASPCEETCENGKRLFEPVSEEDDDDDDAISDSTWLRRSRDRTTMSPQHWRDPRDVQDSNTQTSPAKEDPIAVQDSNTQTSPAKEDDARHSKITLSFAPIHVFLDHPFVPGSIAAETAKPPRTTGKAAVLTLTHAPLPLPCSLTRTRTRA
jgi:hypothetical protein